MRVLTRVFQLPFILIVTVQASLSQVPKDEIPITKNAGRLTFEGGALYQIEHISQGLEDMWSASMRAGDEAPKENLGLFTSKGLLVLPNKANTRSSMLTSLKFLNAIICNDQGSVIFNSEELEIFGMVHTHPDASGVSEHASFDRKRFEWQWTTGKIGNYVIANDGVYRAQRDYSSKWIGFRSEKTYQLIIGEYNKSLIFSKLIE